MTLEEAKIVAQSRVKVRHEYFSDDEWMIMSGNLIQFEDGVEIFFDEWVHDKDWLKDGWSLFKE